MDRCNKPRDWGLRAEVRTSECRGAPLKPYGGFKRRTVGRPWQISLFSPTNKAGGVAGQRRGDMNHEPWGFFGMNLGPPTDREFTPSAAPFV